MSDLVVAAVGVGLLALLAIAAMIRLEIHRRGAKRYRRVADRALRPPM
jgi:hypothetical protein